MRKAILTTLLLTSFISSYGQSGSTWLYNVKRTVTVSTCKTEYCFECCASPAFNFLLTPRTIRPSVNCRNGRHVFTMTDNESKARCVIIDDSLFKKRYITKQLLYATVNFGVQWNVLKNIPVPYYDVMYGAYINLATTKNITIPVGCRVGLGFLANDKFPLTFKTEILTGCYINNIESFASINFGYMRAGNILGNFTPYISVGISKLLINGRHINRNI